MPTQDVAANHNLDDEEKQQQQPGPTGPNPQDDDSAPAFKALGWLDQFLALWIFLAMAIGIILGNFVPRTAEDLQRGKFVGVSVPIGTVFLQSLDKTEVLLWNIQKTDTIQPWVCWS